MKRPPFPTAKTLLASAATLSLGLLFSSPGLATDYVFTGTGNWYDSTGADPNWSPNPNGAAAFDSSFFNTAGNNPVVNGNATYNAGGDFLLGAGNTMTIDAGPVTDGSGASWTQALGTNNWCKIGTSGGSSVVSTVDVKNGGTFNMLCNGQQLRIGLDGGAGSFVVEATGGGMNIAGSVGGTAYSNSLQVASGSSVSLLGGNNFLGEINSSGTVTFGGGTTTTAQWDNAAAAYRLTGGTVTATNYDMNTAGATFNAAGGALNFTGNFTNLRAVTISGGAVSVAGTFNTNASTSVIMTGGSLTKSGGGNVNLNASATFQLSGGAAFNMTGNGEFQPGATFTPGSASVQSISGNATINIAGLVAFQGGTSTKFDINGGALTLGSGAYDGIYSSGGYFNFTTGSSGSILFTNAGSGQTNIFEGQIRYNDTTYTMANYTDIFTVTHPTATSTFIQLMGSTPVPEPSTWIGGALLLGTAGWVRRRPLRNLLRAYGHSAMPHKKVAVS